MSKKAIEFFIILFILNLIVSSHKKFIYEKITVLHIVGASSKIYTITKGIHILLTGLVFLLQQCNNVFVAIFFGQQQGRLIIGVC